MSLVSKKLLKDSIIYTASSFLAKGIGFFLLPFYTRVFSPSDYGAMDLIAISIVLINNLFCLQLNQSLARYYVDTKSKRRKKVIFSSVYAYYFVLFATISFLTFLLRNEISMLLFENEQYSFIITLSALNIFLGSLYYIASMMYRLNFETRNFALLSILQVIVISSSTIIFVLFFDMGIEGVFLGQLIGYILLISITFSKALHNFSFSYISLRAIKKLIVFGAPLVPTVMVLLVMQYIDRYMITTMIGLAALGVYAVALKISSVVSLLLSGFQLAWGPHIYKNHKKPETRKLIADYFYVLLLLSFTLVIFLILFSKQLLPYVVSAEYIEAATVVPILTLSMVFFSLGSYFALGFSIKEKNIYQTYIYLASIVLNIGLNVILIKYFGLLGAAVATAASFFIAGIASLYFSNKLYSVKFAIKKISIVSILLIIIFMINDKYNGFDLMERSVFLFLWLLFIIGIEKNKLRKIINW